MMNPEEEISDYQEHPITKPFCSADPTCPCHEDSGNIAEVAADVLAGLLTPYEATNVVNGQTF